MEKGGKGGLLLALAMLWVFFVSQLLKLTENDLAADREC